MQKILILGLLILSSLSTYAQVGGSQAFVFATLDNSARHAALGGPIISTIGSDPALGYQNPALINPSMHNHVNLTYANYLADINNGFASYARHWDSIGTFTATIGYFDYGTFERTNETGQITGEFDAADYNVQIGYSRAWRENFRIGANVKFLYSQYEAYISTAAAADIGGVYFNEEKRFTAGLVIQNLGSQLIRYSVNEVYEPIPFDIKASFSKKLEHNPLRFTITAHDLHRWDISYVNTNRKNQEIDLETGTIKNQEVGFGGKLMWHMNVGAELIFGPNLTLGFGYNHQRRVELSPEERRAVTGFSWGLTAGIKRFQVSYGMASYFPGISTSYFSLSKNLSHFSKKSKS